MRLPLFLGGVFLGTVTGYAVAILTAPKPGDQVRKDLVDVSGNLYRRAAFEIEDIADKVTGLKESNVDPALIAGEATVLVERARQTLARTDSVRSQSERALKQKSTHAPQAVAQSPQAVAQAPQAVAPSTPASDVNTELLADEATSSLPDESATEPKQDSIAS